MIRILIYFYSTGDYYMVDIVLYEKEGDIGRITLNKPELRNAIDLGTQRALIEAFKRSKDNGDVCVIYTAKGKHFTVGADLKSNFEYMTNPDKRSEGAESLFNWQELTSVMMDHPGIIIVGYRGWVVGGGFEHTLWCDLRVAATDTKIMMPELGMGIFFSNASTKLIPQLIGLSKAKELMLLGTQVNAEEALELGLVNKICEPEELNEVLENLAEQIVEKDTLALKYAKQLINEGAEKTVDEVLYKEKRIMMITAQSEEAIQRVKAFLTKHDK